MAAADDINEYVDTVLQEWTAFVVAALHNAIRQKKLLLTEDLYRSLRWELLRATANSVATAKLYFKVHGRWKDMRTIRSSKQPPVDVLLQEFVQRLGIGKFRYVPGYSISGRMPTDTKAMRRIAWGISRSILKKNQTAAKKWYSKNFYGTLDRLLEGLMGKYQQAANESITNGLTNGN